MQQSPCPNVMVVLPAPAGAAAPACRNYDAHFLDAIRSQAVHAWLPRPQKRLFPRSVWQASPTRVPLGTHSSVPMPHFSTDLLATFCCRHLAHLCPSSL